MPATYTGSCEVFGASRREIATLTMMSIAVQRWIRRFRFRYLMQSLSFPPGRARECALSGIAKLPVKDLQLCGVLLCCAVFESELRCIHDRRL